MSLRAGFLGACPYPVPQGSQVFLRDHARAFREAGHEAHLITYGFGRGEDDSGLPLHRGPGRAGKTSAGPSLSKPFLDLGMLFTVRRVVRREGLQVLFAHNYEALLVALAARACPVVYHAHNTMADELPHYFRRASWAQGVGHLLDCSLPRCAAQVIVPHERLAAHLVHCGVREQDISVVAPPVWPVVLPKLASTAVPTVDYTGNLDAYQNLGLLTAAMQRLREELPTAALRIGTADDCSFPDASVHHVTSVEELFTFLAAESVFALPRVSWSGYPVKTLNAMAAGKAIVACASAAHGLENEKTALIVPDNDAGAFAAALKRLLTDSALRARLGEAAGQQVARAHAPRRVGERLAAIAEAAIAASR